MANVIIVHGLGASPDDNWMPSLKEELEKSGVKVLIPKFPNPNKPKVDEWFSEFSKYRRQIDADTVLVGHSLGCAFILQFLELWNKPVKAVFLVAGFTGLVDNNEINPLIREFTDKDFEWEHIRHKSGMFYIIQSDNDPYVPMEKAVQLSYNLGVKVTLIRKAGHFNERSNFVKFPKLAEMIKKEL